MELSGNNFERAGYTALIYDSNDNVIGAGIVHNGKMDITHGLNPGDDKIGNVIDLSDTDRNVILVSQDEYDKQVKYLSE